MLGKLTRSWAPRATVVSFKLETDNEVLLSKVGLEGLEIVYGRFGCFWSRVASTTWGLAAEPTPPTHPPLLAVRRKRRSHRTACTLWWPMSYTRARTRCLSSGDRKEIILSTGQSFATTSLDSPSSTISFVRLWPYTRSAGQPSEGQGTFFPVPELENEVFRSHLHA